MYFNTSIRWKLILLAFLPILLFLLLYTFYLAPSLRERNYEAKSSQIRDMVDTGLGVLNYYHRQEEKQVLSKEEAQLKALAVIREMNYGSKNQDYFWINDYHPRMIMHPFRPDMEGEDLTHMVDPDGIYLFREFVRIAREEDSGFVEYKWQYYDDERRIEPKLSYVSTFEPWQWIIGTGLYINDIDEIIHQQIFTLSLWSIAILLIICSISLLLGKSIIQPISSMTDLAKVIARGDLTIDIPTRLHRRSDEIGLLASAFHEMRGNLLQAFDKLEASREDLSTTLQSIGDGVITVDLESRITRMNPQAERLTGWSIEEARGRPVQEVFKILHGESGEPVQNPIQRVLETGTIVGLANNTALISRDGTKHLIADTAAPICYESGEITGVVLVFSDVTKEYRINQSLKESEKRYRHLFHHSPVGLLLEDREGNILDFNETFCSLTGYSPEDLVGQNVAMFAKSTDQSVVKKNIAKILEGEDLDIEVESVRKDGEVIYIQLKETKVILPNGEPGILSIQTDITRRKLMEIEVLRQKKWFEALFKDSYDAIIIADRDHCIVDINKSFERLFKYKLEEIEGRSIDEVINLGREDSADPKLTEGLLAGNVVEAEGRRYNREGQPIDVQIKGIPLIVDGELVGGYAIYSDITERKKAYERIRYIGFHDTLTDLYNRSFLEEEIKRLDAPRQLPISVIMVDVNGLKLINDTYGHSMGDKLLISAAKILKETCRQDDIVARWGGDEFVIFLPKTTKNETQRICQRILERSKTTKVHDIPVQMALGAATKEKSDEDIYTTVKEAEDLMYRQKLTEDQSARGKIISTLLKTLREKSDETEEHALRMQKMALSIGIRLGLPPSELDRLTLLLTLHDIGKITIAEEILTKPDSLTEEEWLAIKTHPEAGSRIAASTDEFSHVAKDILSHHERWDGAGYPQGLKGEEIPLLARITTIVDAYDVMTNGRCYKEAMTREEALEELKRCSGTQFDPSLVDLFISSFQESN